MKPFEAEAQVVFDYIHRPQDWQTYGKCPNVEELRRIMEEASNVASVMRGAEQAKYGDVH